ncbi:MAG: cytochrome d ubiquinol oxidase subunit II [Alphaproteobacteria bacterium]|nr:cytochrome d ubiquinol oxidase subunit II [Alphaproteobacteria bacterium]
MTPPLDYATLRLIWWGLLGVLLIGFSLTDGFDLGVAALLPFVGRTDAERRLAINTVGPTWEGNQVWFILGGGAIFAAWPLVYSVSFSGFYPAMLLVLGLLIVRPVSFKYRSKRASPTWRGAFDWALFASGLGPAVVFGVAVGNVLVGLPFRFDSDLRMHYEGGFFDLFGPFPLLCGLLSAAMLVTHGAAWLTLKAERGPVRDRARAIGVWSAPIAMLLFAAGYGFVAFGGLGYRLFATPDPAGPSNPLRDLSQAAPGAWLDNFHAHPVLWIAPAIAWLGGCLSWIGLRGGKEGPAFAGSSLANLGIIGTVGLAMFPFILPSRIDPRSSLTVWNASSSASTLFTMLLAVVVLLPIVLAYTAFVYRVMFGRSTLAAVASDPDLY